ncbi:MAG: ABC-2 family transporter protein [Firmicutes bacterium]|nr:ABC-2 family transporter protein [Bacillota bacterium]MDD4336838.1 ABC-2 family transporter protein [Bacillota bacterium]MDD4791610.1 ABC-2 family transporter protein [Bacillota bacterium]
MRKYLIVIKNTIQSSAEYRANWLISIISFILPVVGIMYLWRAVFGESGQIAGYDLASLGTYYVLSRFLIQAIPQVVWREIGDNIKTGELNFFLLRPIDYVRYYFVSMFANNLIYGLFAAVLTAGFAVLFWDEMILLRSPAYWAYFILSVFGGAVLGFFFGTCLCLAAFWIEDVCGILRIQELVGTILSGALIPLDLMPSAVRRVAGVLPYRYMLSFQLDIYLERLAPAQVRAGLGLMAVWIMVTAVLCRVMWNRGTKRYAAYGG